jgi:capsular polysaccharide transport system ATP-binding protein
MIRLSNVTKYYEVKGRRKYLMRNVSLTIPSILNIGILGSNGAGKSTFLRMLGGIDFPNKGRIISDKKISWPLGLTSGFQGSLTGKENAQFICRVYSRSDAELRRTLDFINEFSELGRYFDMPVKSYSTGMRARLGFAMSLAFEFDYYLIDETLSVGDQKFRQKCTAALKNFSTKRNILLVSHNMKVLEQMCDSGILLKDGEFTYFEDIREATKAYTA